MLVPLLPCLTILRLFCGYNANENSKKFDEPIKENVPKQWYFESSVIWRESRPLLHRRAAVL